MLNLATRILKDYGACLAKLEPGSYGLPESFLPHAKSAIAEAHRVTLQALGPESPADLREALIRGYVYLHQFVDDEEALQVANAQDQLDPFGNPEAVAADPQTANALAIVNRIKLEMEQALEVAQRW